MDQSIAIRIVKNKFCQKLIQALDKPIISTSANLSGEPSPASFKDISAHIINKVDYVVPEKFAEGSTLNPSRLIKFIDDYNFVVIRE